MSDIAKLMARGARLAEREYWIRARLDEYQARALGRLRRFAYARSPFYRELHHGLMDRPLQELPSLSKSVLMERFDEIVTDPEVRRADMERYLENDTPGGLYLGRYYLTASSGTTGRRALFISDPAEWLATMVATSRQNRWVGLKQLQRKRTIAYCLSTVPWHASAREIHFVNANLTPVFLLDAGDPLDSIVQRLNQWQPELLTTYASLARVLAEEQIQGRLRIAPEVVFTGGDVLTEETRARIQRAWGRTVYNAYGASEGAVLAAECSYHSGMHIFEDLVIVENVDRQGRPVAPGEYGAKVLLTVLFRRTVPLIRYELEDIVRVSHEPCPCGRTLRLIDDISGRANEVLWFPRQSGGQTSIHPNFFYRVLDAFPVAEWQVLRKPDALEVLVTDPRAGFDGAAIVDTLRREIEASGAVPPSIEVTRVPEIPRGKTGKALLVRSLLPASTAA